MLAQSRSYGHTSHYAKKAPDVFRFPITIRFWGPLLRKIEIDAGIVRISRRFLSDYERPLSSFSHIGIEKTDTDDPVLAGGCYFVRLVSPDSRKDVNLYNFMWPRFDIDEFAHDLSVLLKLPVRRSSKFVPGSLHY